jgi:hypothetical protein
LAGKLVEAACERDDAAAWACTSTALLESSNKCHSALHEAAIVAIMMVLPAGTDIYDRLQCLPTQIREVVADGIRHGAAGALTEAYLRLCHRTNLRAVTPGFLTADEIPGDVDVR